MKFFSEFAEHISKLLGFLFTFKLLEFVEELCVEFIPWLFMSILGLITFVCLAILVLPAMWIMAYLYPMWEKWIKDHEEVWTHLERIFFIIPLTIIVLVGMMIYHSLHKLFEARIKTMFGLKPF